MTESILSVVHETSECLHKAGAMDKKTMREIESLCLPPVKIFSAKEIKKIREKNKASQSVFATYLNISLSTIQKWEVGKKKPNGTSMKLLNLVDHNGLDILAHY